MNNLINEDVNIELRKNKEKLNTSRENLTLRNATYLETIDICAIDEDVKNIIINSPVNHDENNSDVNKSEDVNKNNNDFNKSEDINVKLETSEEKDETSNDEEPKIKIISSVSRMVYSTPELKDEKGEERERKTSKIKSLIGLRKSKEDSPGEVYVDIYHSGVLVEPGKERVEWRVTLDKDFLRWISDKGSGAAAILNVTSIAASNSGDPSFPHGLLLSYSSDRTDEVRVFAARTLEERGLWMQRILEVAIKHGPQDTLALTDPFPESISSCFVRAGYVTVKEGVSGAWVSTWLLLREREVFWQLKRGREMFYRVHPGTLLAADLRKARAIGCEMSDGSLAVHVDVQDRSLWLRSPGEGDTRRWGHCLHAAALDNGPTLETQQLTRDDVPVIVDKCIDFVAAHGVLCAGVYGHVSSSAAVSQLLSEFRLRDAWRLVLGARSGLDVAAALARFFAELERPLLPDLLARQLLSVACSECHDGVKVDRYRTLLKELPRVHHVTSRRLLGHLHFLQRSNNSRVDLAAAWGPCLVRGTEVDVTAALHELLALYPRVYDVTEAEMALWTRELVTVRLGKFNAADSLHVAVGINTTAGEVCSELGRGEDHMLQEFVLGGALARPLHPSERVLEVVMRWADWDDEDARDNQLVLAPCKFYAEIKSKGKARVRTAGQLKFADAGSHHLATCEVELSQTSLSIARDKKSRTKLKKWKVDDLVWYLGREPKRESCTKWSLTIISKQKRPNRTPEEPFFGCVLGGDSKRELLHWCACLLLAAFPQGL